METDAQRHATWQPAGGRGSFDDISPELPQKKHHLLQERGAKLEEEEAGSEGVRRGRHKGAYSLPPHLLLPPLQGGVGALLLQLKGLREAPSHGQVEVEGGGARALWRAVFPGNRKEKKKKRGRTLPAGAERANQRRDTGDDVIKKSIRQSESQ